LEGLTYGWKRSLTHYHYFDNESFSSLCGHAKYTNSYFKANEFFTEIELATDMSICKRCYSVRQTNVKFEIIKKHQKSESTDIANHGYIIKESTCSEPGCNERGLVIRFTEKDEKEHFCVKHNPRVQETIRKEKKITA